MTVALKGLGRVFLIVVTKYLNFAAPDRRVVSFWTYPLIQYIIGSKKDHIF